MKANNFGKSGVPAGRKNSAPQGLATKNSVGAPLSLNQKNTYPAKADSSGSKGGFPGSTPNNGGGTRMVKNVHLSQPGSGHDMAASRRSSLTGYTAPLVTDKAPKHVKGKG